MKGTTKGVREMVSKPKTGAKAVKRAAPKGAALEHHIARVLRGDPDPPDPAIEHLGDNRVRVVETGEVTTIKAHAERLVRQERELARVKEYARLGAQMAAMATGAPRWTEELKQEARRMRDQLKSAGVRNYAEQTARHFHVTTTRLREVLREAEDAESNSGGGTVRGRVHRIRG